MEIVLLLVENKEGEGMFEGSERESKAGVKQ